MPQLPPFLAETSAIDERTNSTRLSSASSMESKPSILMNGHHKPIHKLNDIHKRVGAPYKVPARSHTIHGHREHAQRSSDSLPLTRDIPSGPLHPVHHPSVTSAPQPLRRVKSEHGSPAMNAVPSSSGDEIPPINIPPYDPSAYAYSPFSNGSPAMPPSSSSPWDGRFPDQFPDNYFVTYEMANEMDHPTTPSSLGPEHTEIDWSTYNLPNGFNIGTRGLGLPNDGLVSSQAPSYASFDRFSHLSHPGLTSSSGEISEVEDYAPVAEPTSFLSGSQEALNDFSSYGGDDINELDSFRLSSASSYVGMPQANMLLRTILSRWISMST
jgi:hypothetical protein